MASSSSGDPGGGGVVTSAPVAGPEETSEDGMRAVLSAYLPTQAVACLPLYEVDIALAWIQSEGLETTEDIAYFFCEKQQAEDAGVSGVWELARTHMKGGLPALQEALRVRARALPAVKVVVARQRGPLQPMRVHGPRARAPAVEGHDSAAKLCAARDCLALSVSWAPAAGLAQGLDEAQRKVIVDPDGYVVRRLARFEVARLKGAIRTWQRWERYCKESNLDPLAQESAVGACILTSFVHLPGQSNTGPLTRYQYMMWLAKHLLAPLPMQQVDRPPTGGGEGLDLVAQATVIQPEMVLGLDLILAKGSLKGDWRATAAASEQAMVLGWVRFTHIQRSRPLERDAAVTWFRCSMGKSGAQGGGRKSFDWCMPRKFRCHPAADILWDNWVKLAHRSQKEGSPLPEGLCLEPSTGVALTLEHFNQFVRESLSIFLPDTDERAKLSSYGLRRASPTLAQEVNLRWEDRVAAGGWAAAVGHQNVNKMPQRYSGGRKAHEAHAKLHGCLIFEHFHTLPSPVLWEAVKVWAMSPDGKKTVKELKHDAAELLLEAGDTELAPFLPNEAVQARLRRKFFRVRSVQSAAGQMQPVPSRAGPPALKRKAKAQSIARAAKSLTGPARAPLPVGRVQVDLVPLADSPLPSRAVQQSTPPPPLPFKDTPSPVQADVLSTEPERWSWIFQPTARGVMHILRPATERLPFCVQSKSPQEQQLRGEVITVVGLCAAEDSGRHFCRTCLRRLSDNQLVAVAAAVPGSKLVAALVEAGRTVPRFG